VLDTQGIESCWPGFELFSASATKGDVVESDSRFIEHVALKLILMFEDREHRLKPERCSIIDLVNDRNRRRFEEALVPLDASLNPGAHIQRYDLTRDPTPLKDWQAGTP
jgi:hypothetical protein